MKSSLSTRAENKGEKKVNFKNNKVDEPSTLREMQAIQTENLLEKNNVKEWF